MANSLCCVAGRAPGLGWGLLGLNSRQVQGCRDGEFLVESGQEQSRTWCCSIAHGAMGSMVWEREEQASGTGRGMGWAAASSSSD